MINRFVTQWQKDVLSSEVTDAAATHLFFRSGALNLDHYKILTAFCQMQKTLRLLLIYSFSNRPPLYPHICVQSFYSIFKLFSEKLVPLLSVYILLMCFCESIQTATFCTGLQFAKLSYSFGRIIIIVMTVEPCSNRMWFDMYCSGVINMLNVISSDLGDNSCWWGHNKSKVFNDFFFFLLASSVLRNSRVILRIVYSR